MLTDYAYTYANAILRFYARNMQVYIDYDVVYFVLPSARSRGAGYFLLE